MNKQRLRKAPSEFIQLYDRGLSKLACEPPRNESHSCGLFRAMISLNSASWDQELCRDQM